MNRSHCQGACPRAALLGLLAATAFLTVTACSPGIGNNLPGSSSSASTASANLPVGFDIGLTPTGALGELAVAGVEVPAIGATAAREVMILAFTTTAAADDGDGSGTQLARDTTTDGNSAADVFLAIVTAQDIDTSAFSQSLAGKFRHPRCATCHSMAAADTQAFVSSPLPHAGPPPGTGFPNNDPEQCAACHVTSSTFPVEGWQAPAASFDFRNRTVAELAAAAQGVPADELEHFVTDKRVLWALDSGILPQVGGRNGIADDDHDGVLEPEDTDGVIRTVPGGSSAFFRDIEAWHDGGMVTGNADAVKDVTLVSRVQSSTAAGNGASNAPAVVYVANPTFDAANAAATNPIGTIYVAFQSDATNLVAGDTNSATDVFRVAVELRAEENATGGAETGGLNLAVDSSTPVLVSARTGTTTTEGDAASTAPSIGGSNGEIVAFASAATNLITSFTDNNGSGTDIFVRDVDANTTDLVSHSVSNQATGGDGSSEAPSVSSNGVAVGYESDATDQVGSDTNSVRDVFVTPVSAVPPYTRSRASVSSAGAEGSGGASSAVSVYENGSGRILAVFQSDKTDLTTVTATTNAFLFDSATGFTKLLNQVITPDSTSPTIGDGDARAPVISGSGATIAFESDSTNLDVLRDDTNGETDIYLLEVSQLDGDLVLPFRANVTASESGDGNGASTGPVLGGFLASATYGTGFVAYSTAATNLGTSDTTNVMLSFLAETSGVIVDFSASVQSGEVPLEVTFTDESSGNPTSWAWDFDNDGTVDSTEQNPTHTYTTGGSYSVKLTAQNSVTEGTKTETDFISAFGQVAADFTITPATGGSPLNVTFTDTSTGPATSWAWDFENDGTVDSTEQNPSFTYSAVGTYDVSLVATNSVGSDTEVKTGAVQVFPPVVADFSGTPLAGGAPLLVNFTDSSTGSPTAWQWDFENDGTVDSTLQNPNFTYTSPGNYTVKLTATGPGGTDDETKLSYVAVAGAVVADFTTSANNGSSIQFTDLTTGSPTTWQWDFDNDGTTDSTQQNPTHTYPADGTYSVRLTATGAGGTDDELKASYITVVTIEPSKDTSIYSEATTRSNGQHPRLVAGNAALMNGTQQGRRRALLEFDVAGNVTASSTILATSLQLTNVYTPSNAIGNVVVSLSEVTTEWGEAGAPGSNSNIGGGTAAATGDATWVSAIVGTSAWSSAGGDFLGQSASRVVGGEAAYVWSSSAMVTDAQGWLDSASSNHGWIVRGSEISGTRTAKVFGSVQNGTAADRPKLTLAYRTP